MEMGVILQKLGYKVENTKKRDTRTTRNSTYQLTLADGSRWFVKQYRDDPWGYYHYSDRRIDIIYQVLRYLRHQLPCIMLPHHIISQQELADLPKKDENKWSKISIYSWDDQFSYNQMDLIKGSPLPVYYLAQLQREIHQIGNFEETLDQPLLPTRPEVRKAEVRNILQEQTYFLPLPQFLSRMTEDPKDSPFPSYLQIPENVQDHYRGLISQLLENWSDDLKRIYHSECRLLHGDLHFENIRFDPDTKRVIRLIDWDSMRYDHPLLEMFSLLRRLVLLDTPGLAESYIHGFLTSYQSVFLTEDNLRLLLVGLRLRRNLFLLGGNLVERKADQSLELLPIEQKMVDLVLEELGTR